MVARLLAFLGSSHLSKVLILCVPTCLEKFQCGQILDLDAIVLTLDIMLIELKV